MLVKEATENKQVNAISMLHVVAPRVNIMIIIWNTQTPKLLWGVINDMAWFSFFFGKFITIGISLESNATMEV